MFILFLILSTVTITARSSSLLLRKIYDPYIICYNPPPPFWALPEGYPSGQYRNTMDLCSAANGQRSKNVGCFCSSSHSKLHCDPALADSTLAKATTRWFNQTNDHMETFEEFCEVACYCSDGLSAATAQNSNQTNSELNRVLNDHYEPFIFGDDNEPVAMYSTNQCGKNCTSNTDCAGGPDGCTCKTQSEQYMPGKGMVMFAAACMISLGGKREEPTPCPCNATYVSHSCCRAPDGIVREPEVLKLGELLKPDEA